jgi:hypothetical protein
LFTEAQAAAPQCGEVVAIETRRGATTRYALGSSQLPGSIAVVLLVGGGGHLNLDDQGCPRALTGNSLVRSLPLFHEAGLMTALVDAPSTHPGEDGLGGYRITVGHAEDLGKIISDVRRRGYSPVWLIGTSRGAISAANAASRLAGSAAPDGLVLTSALMSGNPTSRVVWVAHSMFDLPLEAIRLPTLVVGHAEDQCARSPANLMNKIIARTNGSREQVVTVKGGPGMTGTSSTAACEGRSPHGFIEQEAEVTAGIVRFIRGGSY